MPDDTIHMAFDEQSLSRFERAALALQQALGDGPGLTSRFAQAARDMQGHMGSHHPGSLPPRHVNYPTHHPTPWSGDTAALARAARPFGYDGPGGGPGAMFQSAHQAPQKQATLGSYMGQMSGIASAVAGPAVALYGLGSQMTQVSQTLNTLSDTTANAATRMRALYESAPVFGLLVRQLNQFSDALRGVTAALHISAQRHETLQAAYSGEPERVAFRGQLGTESARLGGVAGMRRAQQWLGFAGLGVPGLSDADRFSPMMMGRFERQIGIAQQRQAAEAELHGADREVAALERRQGVLAKEEERWKASRERGMERFNWFNAQAGTVAPAFAGNVRVEMDDAAREVQRSEQALLQTREQQKAADEQLRDKGLERDRKRHELLKIDVALERERLGVLREQEQLQRGTGSTLSGMLPMQRGLINQFVRQMNERGFESLNIYQRQAIAGAGPMGQMVVQRGLEQMAENDPIGREIQRGLARNLPEMAGAPANLGENLRQQEGLQKRLVELTQQIEANTAEAFAKTFDSFIEVLMKRLEAVILQRQEAIGGGQRVANNLRGQ